MSVSLDHILIPATDKQAAARFLADILGLEVNDRSAGSPPGRFAVVQVGETSIDFDTAGEVRSHHCAFRVSEPEFDAILARLEREGVSYSADPMHHRQGELNDNEGRRGLYFRDPDGHNYELLTRG